MRFAFLASAFGFLVLAATPAKAAVVLCKGANYIFVFESKSGLLVLETQSHRSKFFDKIVFAESKSSAHLEISRRSSLHELLAKLQEDTKEPSSFDEEGLPELQNVFSPQLVKIVEDSVQRLPFIKASAELHWDKESGTNRKANPVIELESPAQQIQIAAKCAMTKATMLPTAIRKIYQLRLAQSLLVKGLAEVVSQARLACSQRLREARYEEHRAGKGGSDEELDEIRRECRGQVEKIKSLRVLRFSELSNP